MPAGLAQVPGGPISGPQGEARALRTTLVESDFAGLAPGTQAPWTATSELLGQLAFDGWAHGPGSMPVDSIDDAFGFKFAGTTEASSFAASQANGHYVSATLRARYGRRIDLSSARLSFSIDRETWFAARHYALFTSADGFASGAELFDSGSLANNLLAPEEFSFFFPAEGYESVSGPLEIRIYAWEFGYLEHLTSLSGFRIERGVPTSTLDLTGAPGGTVFSEPEDAFYATGTELEVFAVPQPGFKFAGWMGDLQGFGNPRRIVLDADKSVQAQFTPVVPAPMQLGTNLGEVADWSTDWPFIDLHQRIRPWATRAVDGSGPWDSEFHDELPVDADGWPTEVPFLAPNGALHYAHTILSATQEAGLYRLSYEGTGELWFERQLDPVSYPIPTGGPQVWEFSLGAGETVAYEIRSSDALDPLRDFTLVHEQHWSADPAQVFDPLFLQRLEPFSLLRFMDWARTNASQLVDWSDRTLPADASQAQVHGASYERMIELANLTGSDVWFCVPHQATDAFVSELAALIYQDLHPAATVYVEYSNETWNTAGKFPQTIYVQDQGELLGLDANRWQAGHDFVAQRSLAVWHLFEDEFGLEAERLVRVLGGHAANADTTAQRISSFNDPAINPGFEQPDVLAIAPYFGDNFTPETLPPIALAYPLVDDLVGDLSTAAIALAATEILLQQELARSQGWDLVAYEGGQHFVGILGAENDETLTDLLIQSNEDPRMYLRYLEYLDMLAELGVGLFANFTYCGEWSKWGTWGTLRVQDQPLAEAHKYRALIDWNAGN